MRCVEEPLLTCTSVCAWLEVAATVGFPQLALPQLDAGSQLLDRRRRTFELQHVGASMRVGVGAHSPQLMLPIMAALRLVFVRSLLKPVGCNAASGIDTSFGNCIDQALVTGGLAVRFRGGVGDRVGLLG